MKRLIRFVAELLCGQPRVIYDRAGGAPYLSRYYLIGRPRMPDGSAPFDSFGSERKGAHYPGGVAVYFHRFHRSDDDHALHNHPWRWAVSLILAGGYREERRRVESTWWSVDSFRAVDRGALGAVETFDYRPGDLNVLTSEAFHRVDLFEEEAWSLFVVGPKFSSWGFWVRETGEFVPWRTFIARLRGAGWDSKPRGAAS